MTDQIGAYRWRVYDQADRGDSPRVGGGNYGTLVLSHELYALPEEDGTVVGPDGARVVLPGAQLREAMITHGLGACALLREAGALVWIPVWYRLDAGLRLAAADENPFVGAPDSGLAGMIYVTADSVERVGRPEGSEWQLQLRTSAVEEVRAFDAWTNGHMHRYIISQFDGEYWHWVREGRDYVDVAQAHRDAEAEIARLVKVDADDGDPSGVVAVIRRAVAELREQLADLAITTRERRGRLAMLMARLSEQDHANPLYVKPGSAHWHGQAHPEADVEAFPTEFHALCWASDVLEQLAEAEHELAAGVSYLVATTPNDDNEQLHAALVSHARGNELYGLATNARKTWEQASSAPFERAPVFASDDEAANTVALRKSASWNMGSIQDTRGVAIKFWECGESECGPRDDG
jgi:hypothetical protein